MALKSLKNRIVREQVLPDLSIDLTAFMDGEDPVILRFRAPRVPDYAPAGSLRKSLRIAFPELNDADIELETRILTMSACYLADSEDEGMEPWRVFGELMRSSPTAFSTMLLEFTASFNSDIAELKADTKNDSTQ